MNIGPVEVFIIVGLCSVPLVVIFIVAVIVVSVKKASRRGRNNGPDYTHWSDPGNGDQ